MEDAIKNVLIGKLLKYSLYCKYRWNAKVIIFIYYSPGNYSCNCNIGYELYTKNGTAGFIIDESETGERDGDTYQRNKTCVPVMCPKLEPPENGKILSTKVCFSINKKLIIK